MPDASELSWIKRAVNRVGTPMGILPFPFAHDCPVAGVGDKDRVFERIYQEDYWTQGESGSGPGSETQRTAKYSRALVDFLDRKNIRSLFDAPCGDLHWMNSVLDSSAIRYVGGDISDTALAVARERCPEAELRHFDICHDVFPDVEAWHCRDALFHLSFDDIWHALGNAAQSNIQWALITTHRARWLRNLDIETGSWRYLDLERSPFNLPQPHEYLRDHKRGEFPRFVGIWSIDDIRNAVAGAR